MGFEAPVVAAIASVLATLAGALFSTLANRRAAQRVEHEASVRQVSEELKQKLEQQRAAQQEAEERVREAQHAAQQRVEELQTAQRETEEQVREAQQAAQQRAEELQAAQEEAEEQVDQPQQNAQQRAEELRAAQQQAEEQAREALRAAQQQAEELDEAQRVAQQRFQDYLDEQLLDEQFLDEHRRVQEQLDAGLEPEFTPDVPAEDTLDASDTLYELTKPRFPLGEQLMRANLEGRLREAKTTLEFQRSIEKFSKWSSRALLAGQFVLGGALTSAFVQQTLSTTLVGSLGLIVLLATIIRERFNPEASGDNAKQKIGTLSKLIRKTEDDLALYDAYQNGYAVDEGASLSLHEMLQAISNGLDQIEDS